MKQQRKEEEKKKKEVKGLDELLKDKVWPTKKEVVEVDETSSEE